MKINIADDSNIDLSESIDNKICELNFTVDGRSGYKLVTTGKELKRIVELINTMNKIQDNPTSLSGLSDMINIMKQFGGK